LVRVKDEEWTKVEVEGISEEEVWEVHVLFHIAQAVEVGTTPLTKGRRNKM
jgi:hypothetical protein